MNKVIKNGIIALMITCTMVFVNLSVGSFFSYAMRPPDIIKLSDLEELLRWYQVAGKNNPFSLLTQDIRVNKSIKLSGEGTRVVNDGGFSIRVMPGATLTIDNPNFELMGSQTVIVVEDGGKLSLKRGKLYVADGSPVIIIKKGGSYTKTDAVLITGSIRDENSPPPTTEAPTNSPPTTEAPTNSLPTTEAPTSPPPTTEAPTNSPPIIGTPVQSDYVLSGRLVRLTEDVAVISLKLPAFSEEITALHLHISNDGTDWKKAVWKNPGLPEEYEDFLTYAKTYDQITQVTYFHELPYGDMWIKAEIVGSNHAGVTNIIKINLSPVAGSSETTSSETDWDGSFGGNRGGGNQQEETRTIESKADQDSPTGVYYTYTDTSLPAATPPLEGGKVWNFFKEKEKSTNIRNNRIIKETPSEDIPLLASISNGEKLEQVRSDIIPVDELTAKETEKIKSKFKKIPGFVWISISTAIVIIFGTVIYIYQKKKKGCL